MRRYSWLPWFAADLVLVVVFAASGRSSHDENLDAIAVLATAAPFLAALVVGTVATRPWRTVNDVWPWGVVVWLVTALGGLGLRLAFGGTADGAFPLVASGMLGLFLLGRRAVAGLLIRNRVKLRA